MKLLILGGTEFVGRAVTEEALARGWQVTVFHRGHHAPLPGVTALRGDRTAEGGLAALEEGEWDFVVDTWSGAPSAVRDSARLLAGRAGNYVYVSSRSLYTYPAPAGLGEDGPVVDAPLVGDAVDGEDFDYARAKRGGELAAIESFGDRALLARAGLIIGPWENVGRLPWWLRRIARGGAVLAPGPRDLALQYIDARDLAKWVLSAAEQGLGGAYNVVSPPGHTTMGALLESCVRVTGSDAELVWTDPERIITAGVEPWSELPIWIPPGELYDSVHQGDVTKAVSDGLTLRGVEETVADTWAWLQGLDDDSAIRTERGPSGLDAEREAKLLREWSQE